MTGTIISGTITTGVDLTNSSYNPVSITSSASISNGSGVALVAAGGTNWTITGAGLVSGYSAGVSITGSGSLINTGRIVANQTGGAPGYTYNSTIGFVPLSGGVLQGGGSVSNAASAVIAGYWEGVALGGGGSLTNAGTIVTGPKGLGVVLTAGGSVSNAATGTIDTGLYGVLALGTGVLVSNQGEIIANSAVGVDLFGGGVVDNISGGISGGRFGVITSGQTASAVVNHGTIVGETIAGIKMLHGGSVSNASGGIINGATSGVVVYDLGSISNYGSIGGETKAAVYLLGGGYITNAASAIISSGAYGIKALGTPTTILNSGSVFGTQVVGAVLFAGGTVSNLGSGVIRSEYAGVAALNVAATAANQGSIYGGLSGVLFLHGGYVTNASDGTITGDYYGVRITNAGGSVDNLGSIASYATFTGGGGFDAAGVDLDDGGTVTNGVSADIRATWKGVEVGDITASVGGTVLNQGFIYASNSSGSTGAAVWIHGPGLISNAASGTIAGGPFAIVAYFQTTVVNYGVIQGSEFAVDMTAGYADRVVAGPGATFFGIVTGGNTIGSSISSTLEFASGASQGTINGLGSTIVDFAQVTIDAGADWTFHSGNTIAAGITLSDAGTLVLAGTTLTDAGSTTIAGVGANSAYLTVTGAGAFWNGSGSLVVGYQGPGELSVLNGATVVAGSLAIDAQGVLNQSSGTNDAATLAIQHGGRAGGSGSDSFTTELANSGTFFANGTVTVNTPLVALQNAGQDGVLEIQHDGDLVLNAGSVDTTQSVSFDDGTGVLTIGTLGGFSATIGNFIAGDEIILPGVSIVSSGFNASSHVLTLFGPSNVEVGTLQFGSSVTNGSDISVNGVTPCFVAGTRIATDRGEVVVEDLRVGDLVRVLEGGVEPVVWVGRRTVDCARHHEPHKVWPVRVSAHAFGEGRPCRDLFLSPDHAVYVDGVLIPVKYLINERTIAQVPRDRVSYYHVELRRHCVLLAEAMTAESYLDTGQRTNFANGGGAIALHADFSSRVWEAEGCAPLVVAGARLEAVRRKVNAIARRRGEVAMMRNRLSA